MSIQDLRANLKAMDTSTLFDALYHYVGTDNEMDKLKVRIIRTEIDGRLTTECVQCGKVPSDHQC